MLFNPLSPFVHSQAATPPRACAVPPLTLPHLNSPHSEAPYGHDQLCLHNVHILVINLFISTGKETMTQIVYNIYFAANHPYRTLTHRFFAIIRVLIFAVLHSNFRFKSGLQFLLCYDIPIIVPILM